MLTGGELSLKSGRQLTHDPGLRNLFPTCDLEVEAHCTLKGS